VFPIHLPLGEFQMRFAQLGGTLLSHSSELGSPDEGATPHGWPFARDHVTVWSMTTELVQWLQSWSQLTLWSGAAVASVFFLGSFLLFPRTVLCLGVGAVFGCAVIPIVLLSTTGGGALAFLLARYLFADLLQQKLDRRPRLRMIANAVDSEGWRVVALLRFWSPVPTVVQNYLFGLTRISLWTFISATFVFSIPQIALYIFLGSSGRAALLDDASSTLSRALMGVAALTLMTIAIWIGRKMRMALDDLA
jgi:uncharacterized membrane protein YdjX (TVP38/TMEM64 family)